MKFRQPEYVWHGDSRKLLLSMSKADLAELVFDFAVRARGESESAERPAIVVDEIKATANAVRGAMGRTPLK